ncbi:MAG: inositol 2-dehydrogenase [Hasllibacter sp.]
MALNLALLGAGRIGQVHADAIAAVPGARLVAVHDPVPESAERIRDAHGAQMRDIDAILAAPDVDAVLICTPTDTHADLIEAAARAGKAIFCEKPVDLSLARVRACLRTVDREGAFLMIGFQRRFEPDFREIRGRIDAGAIGKVEMVTLTSRDPSPPPVDYIRRSGGIFRDMVIHDFDVARWMLGEEPCEVVAFGGTLTDPALEGEDFDSAQVMLRCPSGAMCQIGVSRRATYGYDQRIEVHGSEGALMAVNHPENRLIQAGPSGYTVPPNKHFFITRYIDAYRAEIAAFCNAVSAGAPPHPSGRDGLMALALADAAALSAAEGRVVRMEEIL